MTIRKKLDCFILVRFCKGQTNNKWHFCRHFKAHSPAWRDFFSFSKIQAFSRLLTAQKGKLLFEWGHQKCHVTLWLTLSSRTCYLVTLSLASPLKVSRIIWSVPNTYLCLLFLKLFCIAFLSLFLKWFLHYLSFFIFEVHELSTTSCTVVVFNDDFAEKSCCCCNVEQNLRHFCTKISVTKYFASTYVRILQNSFKSQKYFVGNGSINAFNDLKNLAEVLFLVFLQFIIRVHGRSKQFWSSLNYLMSHHLFIYIFATFSFILV
jgi:hypothetical protein